MRTRSRVRKPLSVITRASHPWRYGTMSVLILLSDFDSPGRPDLGRIANYLQVAGLASRRPGDWRPRGHVVRRYATDLLHLIDPGSRLPATRELPNSELVDSATLSACSSWELGSVATHSPHVIPGARRE